MDFSRIFYFFEFFIFNKRRELNLFVMIKSYDFLLQTTPLIIHIFDLFILSKFAEDFINYLLFFFW